jgi:hypothetical protein
MSSVNNKNEKLYVITYKELIFTFIVFSSILFVLYPKDLLKEQILAESSNYDLSMLYLKNLLAQSPEDESLMLILAEQSLRSGKKDLSLRLLKLLFKSKNRQHREKALLLSYDLKKDDYYYVKDPKRQAEIKKELEGIFTRIYIQKLYKEKNIKKWYQEALFFNNRAAEQNFLNKILKEDPLDVTLLEKSYYIELELHNQKLALQRLKQLQKYDTQRRKKWQWDEYYTYVNFKQYKKAEKLLLQHTATSNIFKNQLADFYLMRKEYKKSSMIYEELFNASREYEKKKSYFYKLVGALEAGRYSKEVVKTIQKYENYYINDRAVRKFMIKKYMAAGSLDNAVRVSKIILQKELR